MCISWTIIQRGIITSASRKVEADLRHKMIKIEADALAESKKHMQVFELDESQINAWKEATSTVVDGYVESAGDLGKQLIKAAKNL